VLETYDEAGPFGAKGIGEPGCVPTAPAVANAIYDAIGVRINDLPITPERILAGIRKKQGLDVCGQEAGEVGAGECIIEE
jgi:CO/xanthine dehydrogenase Mo-binding subunit